MTEFRPQTETETGNARVSGSRTAPRFRLLDASIVRSAFEVRFRATWAECQTEDVPPDRNVSARIVLAPSPRVDFPHIGSDEGESLGNDQLDALVRERASAIVAILDASTRWAAFRKGTRR